MYRAVINGSRDKKVAYLRNGYEYKQETSWKRQENADYKISAASGAPIAAKGKWKVECEGTMLLAFHETGLAERV
jgi:hypothetical protein